MSSMFLNIFEDACRDVSVLRTVWFVKMLLQIAFIVIPLGAIVMLSLDMTKNVVSSNVEEQRKNLRLFIKRCIFIMLVFLVPTFVNLFTAIMDDVFDISSSAYMTCMEVTTDVIDKLTKEAEETCVDGYEWDSVNNLCVFVGEYAAVITDDGIERKKAAPSSGGGTTSPGQKRNLEGSRSTTMMEYAQTDSRWRKVGFCSGSSTISNSGCGASALAMIITGYGNDVNATPKTVRDYLCENGLHKSGGISQGRGVPINSKLMEHYGLVGEEMFRVKGSRYYNESLAKQIKDAADSGYGVIILVPGHYIAVDKGNCSADKVYYYEASSVSRNGCMTMKELWNETWNRYSRCSNNGYSSDHCGWRWAWKYKPASNSTVR